MGYIRITAENIDREHICCAMSNNQSALKKEWLRERFSEGLVFYRSEQRGKCFIEYIPAETAWQPLDADGYMHINCLWVSGSLKGHGYSSDLLSECVRDAEAQGRKGLCILSSAKKKGFLADPKYLRYKGFSVADTSDTGIQLWYLPFEEGTLPPRFKDCAKHPKVTESGFVLFYSDQCPFTYYWVPRLTEAAEQYHVPLKVIHIDTREKAQNAPSPVTNFSLFGDGKFLTHEILSEKKFLAFAGVKTE
jgi:Acetyltransferase (GNAT) family.